MAMKKCPVCGISVKMENLERHVVNQHPRERIEPEEILSEEERHEIRRAAPTSRPAMTRRGKVIAVVVVIILIAVFAALVYRPNVGLSAGQTAPDFTATTSEDGTVHLNALRGRPVLLEFMDVDCIHCINEAPILQALYVNYSGRVMFLGVDADIVGNPDTKDGINTFRQNHNNLWTFTLPDPLIRQTYQVTGTPTMFVLDPNGVIVQAFRNGLPIPIYQGESAYADLAKSLDLALR